MRPYKTLITFSSDSGIAHAILWQVGKTWFFNFSASENAPVEQYRNIYPGHNIVLMLPCRAISVSNCKNEFQLLNGERVFCRGCMLSPFLLARCLWVWSLFFKYEKSVLLLLTTRTSLLRQTGMAGRLSLFQQPAPIRLTQQLNRKKLGAETKY